MRNVAGLCECVTTYACTIEIDNSYFLCSLHKFVGMDQRRRETLGQGKYLTTTFGELITYSG